jgi:hypothetical protein
MDDDSATRRSERCMLFYRGWTKAFYDCAGDEDLRDPGTVIVQNSCEWDGYLEGLRNRQIEIFVSLGPTPCSPTDSAKPRNPR